MTWKSHVLRLTGAALFGVTVIAMASQASAAVTMDGASTVPVASGEAPVANDQNIQLAQWMPPPPGWGRPPPPRNWGWRRQPPPRRWNRPPPPRRYGMPRAHVQYCLRRYRSYNPRTDMYLGYDGRYHYCRSPYRR